MFTFLALGFFIPIILKRKMYRNKWQKLIYTADLQPGLFSLPLEVPNGLL
jgi:hypothetical protein